MDSPRPPRCLACCTHCSSGVGCARKPCVGDLEEGGRPGCGKETPSVEVLFYGRSGPGLSFWERGVDHLPGAVTAYTEDPPCHGWRVRDPARRLLLCPYPRGGKLPGWLASGVMLAQCHIAIVEAPPPDDYELRLLELGISGCFLTNDSPQVVCRGVGKILAGELWFSRRRVSQFIQFHLRARTTGVGRIQ